MEENKNLNPVEQEPEQLEEAPEQVEEIQDVEDFLNDPVLREVLADEVTPAFEDPDEIHEPDELVYTNFANDYGKDIEAEEQERKAAEDKLQIILMIAASALALGIIAILIYWLVAFF